MRLQEVVAADLASSVSGELSVSALCRQLSDAPPNDIADGLIEHFVTISLNSDATSSISAHQVVKISSEGLGTSTKLGNLSINWNKVLREAPSLALTGASSMTDTRLFILAAIVLVAQLSNHAHVNLNSDHVSVIQFIVENGKGSPPTIEEAEILCLRDASNNGSDRLLSAVNRLSELGVVELHDGRVTLREKVVLRS